MSQHNDTHRPMARGPKYRTSCDRCQTAKVKCGHEKPSCRRCVSQKVECVYSLSRRMGRPRAKKNAVETPSQEPTIAGSDENPQTKAATPRTVLVGAEPTTPGGQTPAQEAGANQPSLSESSQRPDSWTPVRVADFERLNGNETIDDTSVQSMTSSLDFVPTDAPMDLDDINSFPPMPSFLEDLPSSADLQRPVLTSTLDLFDPRDLLSTKPSIAHSNDDDAVDPVNPGQFSRQRHSIDGSVLYMDPNSDRFSQTESTLGSSSAASASQMFDCSVEFLEDLGPASLDTSWGTLAKAPRLGTGPGGALAAATPTHSTFQVESNSDLPSTSSSSSRVSVDQKELYCDCLSTITDRIVSLKTEQQKKSLFPIDHALMMESEIEASLSRLHRCKNCCQESSVHLLSLVSVRMMLDVLQKTARDEFVSRPRRASVPGDNGILLIGTFRVATRTRCRFLQKVVQARLYRLALLVEEREKLVNRIRQDSYSKSGSLLLGDISRGLRTIMGWVELWNSKH